MSNYGIKVAKEGYNVLTAEDTDLAFSSAFPISQGRVKLTINLTVTAGLRLTVTVINDSLDYLAYTAFGMWSTGNGFWHSIHTTYNETNTQLVSVKNLSNFGKFKTIITNGGGSDRTIQGTFYAMDDGADS